ncbi:MAG: hypothetical protein ABDH20_01170 [Thermus sp.]
MPVILGLLSWANSFRLEFPRPKVLAFITGTFVAFTALEVYLFFSFWKVPVELSLGDLVFWGLLMFWSVGLKVRLPLNASVSQLFIFALTLLVLAPPWIAPLLVFFFQPKGNVWYKQLFNRSQDALATAVAAITWIFFQKNPLYLGALNLSTGIGVALAALSFFVVNITLVGLIIYVATQTPLNEIWRKNFGWSALSYLLLSPLSLLLARAYETPSSTGLSPSYPR